VSKTPAQDPQITASTNGPLIVRNLVEFVGVDGEPIASKDVMALCRCGQSKTRPFCDGTHASVGFEDGNDGGLQRDDRKSYKGKAITIHDNRGICSHAADCTERLARVFNHDEQPWINPDNAEVDEIIEIIDACPSGALSYTIDGAEHRDLDQSAEIEIEKHGPYRVKGAVAFEDAPWFNEVSREHYALCRCGHSKNKPFCDGAHWHARYRDDDKIRVVTLDELKEQSPLEVELLEVQVTATLEADAPKVKTKDGRQLDVEVEGPWDEVMVSRTQLRGGAVGGAAGGDGGADTADGPVNREEPHHSYIRHLAKHGLKETGAHGRTGAMGVPRYELPTWDDLQFVTAQLHKVPQLDDVAVDTKLVVGPGAAKPLELDIPIIVSDMSFGALSFEAKVALAMGAQLAGTGTCSGEGGMMPEEQAANSRYFYELASARFGFSFEQLKKVQAFHFKLGQGAKTGTGGHLPGSKVNGKIASVRRLEAGQDAISPARFPEWTEVSQFRDFAAQVREETGGIPIGVKLSAQHIEKDIDAALEVGVDYIILDGRGGGTGAAPLIFRDHISVPTLPALARARQHLDKSNAGQVTLFITGGLRTPADFTKALALGADGIAIANSAIQAIGCIGARQCNKNTCPMGIATQDEALRQLINVESAAADLHRFLDAATHLMGTLARACGYDKLGDLCADDLTTWKRDVAYLTGVNYGGVVPL
jgi:methylamine---glutamate N-methyltransferase subunit C